MTKKLFLLSIFVLGICMPQHSLAASFSLDLAPRISRNEEVLASLIFHADKESINAISGELNIPQEVDVVKVVDGNSSVLIWLEKPVFHSVNRTVSFSGLTPGGMTGDRLVFSLVLKSSVSGTYPFSLSNPSALKNDGKGTSVKISLVPTRMIVLPSLSTSTVSFADSIPPESFVPTVGFSTDSFDNKTFVSFLTQDKGVGIDHYEYATSYFQTPVKTSFRAVESPLVLASHEFSKRIYIKAVDKAGNERMSSVTGPRYYVNMSVWGIIISFIIICVLYIRKRFL